jgi:orotidine-5'-phosphate decarboxylase
MSSKNNLITQDYTDKTLQMAEKYSEFVFGFIGQHRFTSDIDFIYMTPGVQLETKGDSLGQQYRTPEQVILESNCDIIIVGRGIYGSGNVIENAKKYQKVGWQAYLDRINKE